MNENLNYLKDKYDKLKRKDLVKDKNLYLISFLFNRSLYIKESIVWLKRSDDRCYPETSETVSYLSDGSRANSLMINERHTGRVNRVETSRKPLSDVKPLPPDPSSPAVRLYKPGDVRVDIHKSGKIVEKDKIE